MTTKASKNTKNARQSGRQKTRKRSTILSVVLGLVIIHGLLLTLMTIGEKNYQGGVTHPVVYGLFLLGSALDVVAGLALWYWQKWGLNLYLAATIMTAFVGLINTGSLLIVFAAFLPLAVVGYVVRREWRYFE